MKKVLLFAVIALAASIFVFYNNNVIKASWQGTLYEIGVVAVLVFIFLIIGFVVAKMLIKTSIAIKNKTFQKRGRL